MARDGFKSNVPAVTGRRPFRNPVNDVLKSSFQTGVFDPDDYVGEILFSASLFTRSVCRPLRECSVEKLFHAHPLFFLYFFFFFFFS